MARIPFLILIIALVIAAAGVWFLNQCEDDWCFLFEWQKVRAADSFERCAALGFPMMESYPRQCRAGAKSFVETVSIPQGNDKIRVTMPVANAAIASPLVISGEARGAWYFEASFPIRLYDANKEELAVAVAQAKGEWMTTDFVPFEVIMNFPDPATETGTLVFEKDNPSGLPEYADSFSVPVRFFK
ncbi:MAG: Gmad2 immunoglobulin-like domain-containing protein [Candidatus Sungbacteria bacterium]|nr:Gmad2 immunoglobulin-like domain-containing protein [Candidatus Sungbacteria bacterium]